MLGRFFGKNEEPVAQVSVVQSKLEQSIFGSEKVNPYKSTDYQADLKKFLAYFTADEKVALTEDNIDSKTFLNDLARVKTIAASEGWAKIVASKDKDELKAANDVLDADFAKKKFTTGEEYPAVVGPRTEQFARAYLLLLKKSLTIETPKVSEWQVVQSAVNYFAEAEKANTRKCISELLKAMQAYQPPQAAARMPSR